MDGWMNRWMDDDHSLMQSINENLYFSICHWSEHAFLVSFPSFVTNVEAEAPRLWPPHVKSRLTGKGPDAGKDWGQEEKGVTEDEMVGWHQWLNRHELEQTSRDGEGMGKPGVLYSVGVTMSQTQLWEWTKTCVTGTYHEKLRFCIWLHVQVAL